MRYSKAIILLLVIVAAMSGCKVQHGAAKKRGDSTQTVTTPTRQHPLTQPMENPTGQTARLIAEARKWIGTPYVYGGHSRSGTDCSGLVMELFKAVYDIKLPRSAAQQHDYTLRIERGELQPGDLLFFATGKSRQYVSHVGLYIGHGRMIHASASRGVMESGIEEAYFTRTYHSGGRLLAPDIHPVTTPEPTDTLRPFDLLEEAIEQQIDSIYVSEPFIFDRLSAR